MSENDSFRDDFEPEILVSPTAPQPVEFEATADDLAETAASAAQAKSKAMEAAQEALNRDEVWRQKNEEKTKRASLAAGITAGLALVVVIVGGAYGYRASQLVSTLGADVTPVVTVRRDVARGRTLTYDDLAVQEVPSKFAPRDAIVAESVSDDDAASAIAKVVGKETAVPLSANTPVYSGLLQGGDSKSDVTLNIASGDYGMMVQFDTPRGMIPLLHVGDRVNVLVPVEGSDMADIIIRDAKVIALDGYLYGGPDSYSTVTLDLTEEESRKLANASNPWLSVLSYTDRQGIDEAESIK